MFSELWQRMLEHLPESWTRQKEPIKRISHDHEQNSFPPIGGLKPKQRKRKKSDAGMASNERTVNDNKVAKETKQEKPFPKFSYSEILKKNGKHPSLRPNRPKQAQKESEQYNNIER